MSIAMKKFQSMLDEVLKQNTEISPKQGKVLRDACLNLYVKLTAVEENARMSAEIRDDIRKSAVEFYKMEKK